MQKHNSIALMVGAIAEVELEDQLDASDMVRSPGSAAYELRHRHRMPFGAEYIVGSGVRFRIWAPSLKEMRLIVDEQPSMAMTALSEGWHERVVPDAVPSSTYQFVLPDGTPVPDPASRFQPKDVAGPSEVIDPCEYSWRASAWTGRPWHEAVLYELHVGTFTAEGTFRAAMERLDYLEDLGITAIEVMPVADFPGARSWGYDGALMYAPDSSYGRPEDFKRFIDAAHERGIQVLLDVVYNHFGPEGNYLSAYAPDFFTERHHTPWGAALNFDDVHSATVREFVIHNALFWLEEYQLDGLRLDAVHAIIDESEHHVLKDLAERVRRLKRHAHLILENEENGAELLTRAPGGVPHHYTAQWNDDVHHVLHVAATGESTGYYADYIGDTELLGRALAEGFAFQGQVMEFRGSPRGEPSASLPPGAFVAFIQNHDQIGNRAFGERLSVLASPDAIKALAAVYLLLPQAPLLFMGEEWGARQPFLFFSNFNGELAGKIRRGRRQEFAHCSEFQDEKKRALIPDPEAVSTFHDSKLCWDDLADPTHAAWHDYYRRLLKIRHQTIRPLLPRIAANAARYRVIGPGAVVVTWQTIDEELQLELNLSNRAASGFSSRGAVFWQGGTSRIDNALAPWSVVWSLHALRSL